MTYKIRLPLLVCWCAFLVGCNSLNWHANDEYLSEGQRPRVYPGVSADCEGLAKAHSTGMYAPFIFTYSAVDMPFSLIVDTLYVPSDMVAVNQQKKRDLMRARTNESHTALEPTAGVTSGVTN